MRLRETELAVFAVNKDVAVYFWLSRRANVSVWRHDTNEIVELLGMCPAISVVKSEDI